MEAVGGGADRRRAKQMRVGSGKVGTIKDDPLPEQQVEERLDVPMPASNIAQSRKFELSWCLVTASRADVQAYISEVEEKLQLGRLGPQPRCIGFAWTRKEDSAKEMDANRRSGSWLEA
jgi:hypothetical protein